MATTQPICVHSLFRASSTYFFQKFRVLGRKYTCFQEPFNEFLVALNDPARHGKLLESPHGSQLRHPRLDKPYFYEFWVRRERLQGLFHEAFAYQQYFVGDTGRLPQRQIDYLSALIEQARGRPVLQFCRSSGRAASLRREFGGLHLHLWREPRNQWWSYKVADYFDSVSQRIYYSNHLPPALEKIAALAGIDAEPVAHLSPRANYMMFYALWLDAWLRLSAHTDLSINVDAISVSRDENADCSRRLSELVGHRIDLSDVRVSGMVFAPDEQAFYAEAESAVNSIFVQTRRGTSRSVAAAGDAARCARRAHENLEHDAIAERNLRQTAVAMMQRLAGPELVRQPLWSARFNPMRLRDYWRSWGQARSGSAGASRTTPIQPVVNLTVPTSSRTRFR